MADIHCAVCGEPWFASYRDDMQKWQAELFRAGAGCPCCEGEAPEGVDADDMALQQARDLVIDAADANPHAYASVNELGFAPLSGRPAWKAPEPVVAWTCDGCGIQHRSYADDDDSGWEYHAPPLSKARGYYCGHALDGDRFDEKQEPAGTVDRGEGVEPLVACSECMCSCHECGATLIDSLEANDTYDPGIVFLEEGDYTGQKPYCIDCYEKLPRCGHCSTPCESHDDLDSDNRGPCCRPKCSCDGEDEEDDDPEYDENGEPTWSPDRDGEDFHSDG